MGGDKASVKLGGRHLITYPLEAVWRALGAVAVVAKRDSELPPLPGVVVWIEPDQPRHPLAGIVHALRAAQGRPVVVCAADLPLVGEELIRALAMASGGGARTVVACAGDCLQPTLGCYGPAALEPLAFALNDPNRRLTDVVTQIGADRLEVADPEDLFNVNTPEDLLQAAAILDRRRLAQPNVKS